MNIELLRPTYDFALFYAQRLVADLSDEQICAQPVEGRVMNHPAFLIGHLAWANDNGAALVGLQPALGAEWKELFGMGTKPLNDRSRYPNKEALLKALENAHAGLLTAVTGASPDVVSQPAPERMRHMFPTVGHMLAGLMTSHYTSHLGQLSAWRRAMGLPSVF